LPKLPSCRLAVGGEKCCCVPQRSSHCRHKWCRGYKWHRLDRGEGSRRRLWHKGWSACRQPLASQLRHL
jgi:hypothetical protein